MSQNYEAEIAAFIRSRGVTHCPTAYAAPTWGISSEADRVVLRRRANELELAREERIRQRPRLFSSHSLQNVGLTIKAMRAE